MIRKLFLTSVLCIPFVLPAQVVTMEFLQGQWSLEKITRIDHMPWGNDSAEVAHPTYDGLMTEEESPNLPDDNIWTFEGDVCTRYNYPFTLLEQAQVALDSDSLNYAGWKFGFAVLYAHEEKLFAFMDYGALLTFRRDTFSAQVLKCLNVLLQDTINPGLMLESYHMVTHFVPDDEAAYDFEPPLKMPTKISITDTVQAQRIIHSDIIYLKAGRKMRPFHVTSVVWDPSFYAHRSEFAAVDVPVITLYPGDWWTGQPFQVIYRADEKEMVRKKPKK